ncbi:MAG: pyridoxamine 5'-phosphate oxidase family protein [Clostridiales bacterium]|nr:pyridoxamine 5'-phosphate oxidase family protein [Clostridiales bacterium]
MFREMMRKNKQLPREECIRLLQTEKRGVLSVLGDHGYPYGMPMNHWYDPETDRIYFHCGKAGHRLDALKTHSKVSFCIFDEGSRASDHWALTFKSVIAFGTVKVLDDREQIIRIATALSHKFTSDDAYIQSEIEKYAKGTLLLEMTVEHISGKQVEES